MTHIISVSSGKGGVGKTLTAVHLAHFLQKNGHKVFVIDADLGLANVNVVLGINPLGSLEDVYDGFLDMRQIIVRTQSGFDLLPSGSGIAKLANLNKNQRSILMEMLDEVIKNYDIVIIDTGAGISNLVLHFASIAEQHLVVTTPEPHAMTDAYAFIKVLNEKYHKHNFDLVVNQVRSELEGKKVHQRLAEVGRKFIDVTINLGAVVPHDEAVQHSVLRRALSTSESMQSVSAQAWAKLSNQVEQRLGGGTAANELGNSGFGNNFVNLSL